MNINFRKSINKNHMIIENAKDFSVYDFETKMILENSFNFLLPSDYEIIDEKVNFLYDISSKQSFSKIFDISKMKFENLRAFMFALNDLSEELDEYLLDANNIILKEDCIFSDMRGLSFSFCYYPYYYGSFSVELKELFNNILECIDYEDTKVVKLAYRVAKEVQNENFILSDLMSCFEDTSDELIESDKEVLSEEVFNYEDIEWIDPKDNISRHRNTKANTDLVETDNLVEKLSFFEKLKIYFNNTEFSDVLDDVENGEMLKKVKGVVSADCFLSSENRFNSDNGNSLNLQSAFEGVSINYNTDISNLDLCVGEKPQDGTTYLAHQETKNRRLVGINDSTGQLFEIKKMPFTIGKIENKVDALINSRTVSRIHARIYEESNLNDDFFLEDLNSTNGTFLNYKRIEPYQKIPLCIGDIICFADEEFCFK